MTSPVSLSRKLFFGTGGFIPGQTRPGLHSLAKAEAFGSGSTEIGLKIKIQEPEARP